MGFNPVKHHQLLGWWGTEFATFLMTHTSEEWLRNQRVVLPPRGTLARQRNGLTGASGCSIRGSANLCSLKSLGKTILASSSKLRATQLESSFTEKALGVLLDTKFNKRQQCALQARKVNGNDSRGLGCASLLSCDTLTLRLGCNHIKSDFNWIWNYLKSRESVSKDTTAAQFGSLPIGMVSQQMWHNFVVQNMSEEGGFLASFSGGMVRGESALQRKGVCRSELGKLPPTPPWDGRGVKDRVQQGNMLFDCKRWQEQRPAPTTQTGSYSIYF